MLDLTQEVEGVSTQDLDGANEAPAGTLRQLIQCEGKGGDYVWLAGNDDTTVDLANTLDTPQRWLITNEQGGYTIVFQHDNGDAFLASDNDVNPKVFLSSEAHLWTFDLVAGNIYRIVNSDGLYLYGHTSNKEVTLSKDANSSGSWWAVASKYALPSTSS